MRYGKTELPMVGNVDKENTDTALGDASKTNTSTAVGDTGRLYRQKAS